MRSNNEPVRIRYKDLANGTKSIYLDTYKSGKRSYEFLKLYLLPEDDDKAKAVNAETLQKAEAIKNQRVQEILSGKLETVKASLEHPASTTTSSKKTARASKKENGNTAKTRKSAKGKESETNEVVGAVSGREGHQWKFIDDDGEDRAIDGTIKKHRGRPNKREAVTLRFKNLANGSKSLYFDIYYNGERKYEFLKLYINPEITEADKQNNALVMETAERLKERKTREVVNGETFTDPSDELNLVEKVEEYTSSVIVRSRKMRNGDRSLFLDIYYGKGQRAYESVGLYLRKDDSEEKHKEIWKEAEKKAKERMKALKDGTFEKRVGRRGYKPHGEDPDANVDKYKEGSVLQCLHAFKSVYLSINVNGRRTYDYLRLYLIPEVDAAAREQNKQTMQAVYAIKAQRIMSITNGIAGLKDKSRIKMRLVDWLEIFRDAQVERGRQSARNWVNSVLNAVREHSPNVTLAEMTKEYCNGFMVFLLNDYITYKHTHPSKSTVMNYLKCLKAAFNMAIEEEIMDDNPVLRLRMDVLKGGGTKREYLTVDEVKRLIDTPCKREDIKAAFLFSCFCGLRISDVKSLKWKNIITEGDKTRVEILQYKTKQPLYLPLNKQALRWMPERGSASDEDNVFPTLPSKNYDCIPEWSRAAGISKHVTYHVSRHTFATMELTMGADLYTTSKLLGHTEVRTTQIYAKIINKKKDEAVSLLDSAFEE